MAAVTAAVFCPAVTYRFVNFDDNVYGPANREVAAGLSPAGARWAFTTFYAANWHPLTWLSLQADLLRRVRPTESQYLLSHAQRKQNVHNAFQASDKVRGLQVLLVDDVYTSGATVAECTRALLKVTMGS